MKKRDLATLAMIGISAGLIVGGCQQNSKDKNNNPNNRSAVMEHMSPDMQTFSNSLSRDAKEKFQELDAQHKMMATEMANQNCSGQNMCAGMGGCATSENSCAGHNACSGRGGPPVKDPNKAVEVQHKNQMNGY